jgi:hypothetical protein
VLTTGSALTFDGTNFALGAGGDIRAYNTANTRYGRFATTADGTIVESFNGSGEPLILSAPQSTAYVGIKVNNVEQARFNTTGLGIGTSSPAQKLNVVGNVLIEPSAAFGYAEIKNQTSTAGSILRFTNGSTTSYFGKENSAGNYTWSSGGTAYATVISAYGSTAPIQFGHNTPSMTLDSSGNLGLGVTPSAWSSSMRVLQVASTALYNNGFNDTFLGANFYNDTVGTNRYINSDFAAAYGQVGGAHQWFTAPSGTAGNAISFTQAMTLDVSGNLGVGTTSPSSYGKFAVIGSGTTTSVLDNGAARITDQVVSGGGSYTQYYKDLTPTYVASIGTYSPVSSSAQSAIVFADYQGGWAERARITSGGNLLVGTTSSLSAFSGARATFVGTTGFVAQTNQDASYECGAFWHPATSGNNTFAIFGTEATYTTRGSITYNRAGGLVAYNTTSDYRAKDIIGPVINPGATIDALKVYEGRMKGATQSRPMLVAHEAQAVAPYSVTGEKDAVNENGTPKFQQMDVSSLVPLLIAELQSLRARVAQLEAK